MSARLSIETLQRHALSRGGRCLSADYKNNSTKYQWECAGGHVWFAAAASVVRGGKWCPHCSGNARLTLDVLRAYAESNGGQCLSTTYTNARAKYLWWCSCGNRWQATAYSVANNGSWCPKCAGNKKLGLEQLQGYAESKGGKCLSMEYVNSQTHSLWECKCGYKWFANSGVMINQETWCPVCSNKQSKKEIELRNFVRQYFPDTPDKPVKKLLPNKLFELDIWVPSLRKAIEFDGEYRHNQPESVERDARKDAECQQVGIQLLRVKYRDYVKNTDAVQQRVLEFLASP